MTNPEIYKVHCAVYERTSTICYDLISWCRQCFCEALNIGAKVVSVQIYKQAYMKQEQHKLQTVSVDVIKLKPKRVNKPAKCRDVPLPLEAITYVQLFKSNDIFYNSI